MTEANEPLAIDGGKPVREQSLPQEWPGAMHMDEQEVEAVARVARSRSLFRFYGPNPQNESAQLETEFAEYVGRKYALGVNSGTTALQVALSALGCSFGDEVIMPGYFWISVAAATVRCGAIPVLADVDDTWGLDPEKLEDKITDRTKAIIMVHMGGVIGRVKEVAAVAKKHGIPLLEDCAQAAGASQDGKQAGTFGDIAIYSFQLNKNMTTGEGGMVVTDDDRLYARASAAHDLGYVRGGSGRLGLEEAETQTWGVGGRMNELIAAVARVQLRKLDTIVGNMRSTKNRIKEALSDIDGFTFRKVLDPENDGGAFLYVTFQDRDVSLKFVKAIQAEGICGSEGGMYPVHMDDWGFHIYHHIPGLVNKVAVGDVSVWDLAENAGSKNVSYEKGTCPYMDERATRTMVMCIPSKLEEQDIQDIITGFRKVASHLL